MPDFPVIEVEIQGAENALGVRLPDAWKSSLLDPRIRRALQDKRVGALREGDSMAKFVELTKRLRREQPEFPRDAVVMSCGQDESGEFRLDRGGYVRVSLPDKKDPSKLADFLHSWDLVRRRMVRDCSTRDWIDSKVARANPELLAELGIVARDPWGEPEPLATRTCEGELLDALNGRRALEAPTWFRCGETQISGRFLTPCDLGQTPTMSHAAVAVTPGVYECCVELGMSEGRDSPVVTATRMVLKGAKVRSRTQVASLDIDLAAVAIFDRQAFFKAVKTSDRDSFGERLMELTARPLFASASRTSEIFITPTGAGDGRYPAYALSDGERPVGLELSFVE